ncbi:hypothetical protein WOLCODRAFT_91464 [Wolfiporia cocos MD-104 SS10]|uniref:RING-Gid-type domain-containing protein n=1 Tax=Wolfiporia cocos (strain MD-104) TaxID=742152 RepID=A0A2H3J0G5_WOLCO|nr:hypothetical protein WOLCODRAFT_91464 [Wolfiporia cocos MD-104 SS10]
MSSSKLNIEGIMLFEQPFARVPCENYRKVFRTSQKNIERDLGTVQAAASDLAKRGILSSSGGEDDAIAAVDGMISRVENLKRKLTDLNVSAGQPTLAVMRERLVHLSAVENMQSTRDPDFARWADTRLDRWLVDWALRHGRERTARMITHERGVERLVDIELFSDIRRIEEALKRQSCSEALAWCSENKIALRKLKEYIELARARRNLDAIAYAKKHLLSWQDTHLAQIRQATALLAFSPTTNCAPYKRLYNPERWDDLIKAFRLAIYNLNTLPTEPLLHLAMYAGLASLKLPACYDKDTKNIDCPACDASLGKLAEEVPFSHHVNSTIVCRISGKIMDEDNAPMAFPTNGEVYSKEALEEMAAKNDGYVICPRSGEKCKYTSLRRVYIS